MNEECSHLKKESILGMFFNEKYYEKFCSMTSLILKVKFKMNEETFEMITHSKISSILGDVYEAIHSGERNINVEINCETFLYMNIKSIISNMLDKSNNYNYRKNNIDDIHEEDDDETSNENAIIYNNALKRDIVFIDKDRIDDFWEYIKFVKDEHAELNYIISGDNIVQIDLNNI